MTADMMANTIRSAPLADKKVTKRLRRLAAFSQGFAIRRRYREYTMVPWVHYATNVEICATLAPNRGCIVECGVWRAGMSAGLADALPGRVHYLFDSFEGLPPAQQIDGSAAQKWQSNTGAPEYCDNCRADISYADRAMKMSRASKFTLVPGWFSETLPGFVPAEGIAVLRLDGDWYASTIECLSSLYDHVLPRGLIIIDDYYAWDGCTRAVHDFLSKQQRTDRIQSTKGVCFIIKSER
jgi:O-methyltransferase